MGKISEEIRDVPEIKALKVLEDHQTHFSFKLNKLPDESITTVGVIF